MEIGNSVTKIGEQAFWSCKNLKTAVIGNSVTSIDRDAFFRCSNLTSVVIGNSVTSIGEKAFYDCISLTSIEIPNSVTSIGSSAFDGCSSLNKVIISDISAWCNITFDWYTSNPLDINGGKLYLNEKEIVELKIPDSVSEIKPYVFCGCSSLTSIEIPNSVTSIGHSAFTGCSSLTSIEIPNSVTSIGYSAFSACSSLKKLIFEDGEDKLTLNYYRDSDSLSYSYVSFSSSPLENLYLGRNLDYTSGVSGLVEKRFDPFLGNTGFKNISLGKYVTKAKSIYPQESEGLEVINCNNSIPPEMREFTNVQYANIIVNIPKGAMEAYKADEVWGKFWNLQETLPAPVEIESVSLNVETVDIVPNDYFQLEATVTPNVEGYNNVIWSSSDEKIATVSENGLVTALSVGTTTITASCGGVSATCDVNVVEKGISIDFQNNLLTVSVAGFNESLSIALYSVFGQCLLKESLEAEVSAQQQIDLSNLNSGTYIVQVISGDMNASQRIVKN